MNFRFGRMNFRFFDPLFSRIIFILWFRDGSEPSSNGSSDQFGLQCAFYRNIVFAADLSHGVWRDAEAVWSSLGLAPFVRLMAIVFNLAHSPVAPVAVGNERIRGP